MIRLFLALFCLLVPPAAALAAERAPLILVSIDGFRAEYARRGRTPVLTALAREGASAPGGMRPSFPSLTYPNHYTLVTGLRPDHHGLVDNVMTDPAIPGVTFTLSDRATVEDERWWGRAEPLWVTVEKAGLVAAPLDWPGSEAPRGGRYPTHWRRFDAKRPNAQRVDDILALMDLPEGRRPDFSTLYFDAVDNAGHEFGPTSPQLTAALGEVDAALGRLVSGLKARGLYDKVNLVVVADHGMAEIDMKRRVPAEDWVSPEVARLVNSAAVVGFVPQPGHEAEARRRLLGRHPTGECWDKAKVPARFHYGTNPRVPPIVCLSDVGAYVVTRAGEAKRTGAPNHGSHGYDPDAPQMRALFIARGPAIRRGVRVASFDNVDIQPFLGRLLGLTVPKSDGDPRRLAGLIRTGG
jgi:predicted AlkP superfamily pyrophosphatase or phosphodiesterase